MAIVMAKKSPKQVAKPIIGPEGGASNVNTNNKVDLMNFNICNKPFIIRTPFWERGYNMNSKLGIPFCYTSGLKRQNTS